MRTSVLALIALSLILSSVAQIPALGDHEFADLTVTAGSGSNFPSEAQVVARNYTVQNPYPGVVRALGYRLAVVKNNTAAGVAFDVVAGSVSTLFDAAVGVGYYGKRAGVSVNPTSGNATVGFAEAAWAFVTRFFYIAEFNDINNNNKLEVNTELIGGYDLASFFTTWNPVQYGRLTENGVGYYYAQAETSDGVFAFRVVGTGGFISGTEGTTTFKLNPTSLKISVSIRYYNNSGFVPKLFVTFGPSSAITYPNAKIALIVGFGAAAGARGFVAKANVASGDIDFNGNQNPNIAVTGAGNTAGFSWAGSTVTRNSNGVLVAAGAAGAAVASAISDDLSVPNVTDTFKGKFGAAGAYAGFVLVKVGVFAFAEPRPTSVVWDPTVSTTDTETSPAIMVVPALLLLLALLSMLLM